MERILYNKTLKKFFITILLVTLLVNYLIPYVVFAETTNDTKTYKEWLSLDDAKGYESVIEEEVIEEFCDNWLKYEKKEKGEEYVKSIVKSRISSQPEDIRIEAKMERKTKNSGKETFEFKIDQLQMFLSYSDWLKLEEAKGFETEIENAVITFLCNYVPDLSTMNDSTKAQNEARKLYLAKPESLFICARISKNKNNKNFKFKISQYGVKEDLQNEVNGTEKQYYQLLKWLGKDSVNADPELIKVIRDTIDPEDRTYVGGFKPSDLAKTILNQNKSTIIFIVKGTNTNYVIDDYKVPGKDKETLIQEAVDYMGVEAGDGRDTFAGGVNPEIDGNTYTATGTIQGIVTSMQTLERRDEEKSIATIRGKCASEDEKKEFERVVKEKILEYLKGKNFIEAGQDENKVVEQVYKGYKDESAILVTVGGTISPATLEVKNVTITLAKEGVSNVVGAGELEDVDFTATAVDKYGQEYDINVDANGNEITDDDEDDADFGGILLSPIFYLINFVADAIISNVGNLMKGSGLSVVTGTKLLQGKAIPPITGEGAAEFVEISTESFIGGYQYPNMKYTPEEIFAGKIDLLSIDFISGKNYEGVKNTDDAWLNIRTTIAQWYQVLRMIAIIGLLSVLIYTGIKIIISANAKDKAKFKEWILNWLLAVAILFAMHIIMAFIVSVTGEFSKLLSEATQAINIKTSDGNEFSTNLMGLVRFMIQSEKFAIKVGYEVMYIALIVYTIKFTFIYLKRVLNMAFLTLIAPIVALTYPLDKVNDGKAQGFDMWLKEYIFNALLQPMHQIMYYILVGSAVTIAAKNPIYGIAVLMFMTEAEKLLKQIFGFQKASGGTVGGMAGAFAAGALASNIKNIAKMAGGAGGKGGIPGGDDAPGIEAPKPTNKPTMSETFNFPSETESQSGGQTGGQTGEQHEGQTGGQHSGQVIKGGNTDLEAERQNLASERSVLEEFEAEGATSDTWSDEDYDAYQELEREQLEKEEQLRMQEQANAENDSEETSSEGEQPESGSEGQPQPGSEEQAPETPPQPETPQNDDSGQPIREMAEQREAQRQERQSQGQDKKEESKFRKGTRAAWRKLVKPVWDYDKSKEYNYKRLGRKAIKGVAKGIGGFALGTAAAAIQAGISITDGKYNPMEGIATFSAGFAGASNLTNRAERGIDGLVAAYREGAYGDDDKEQMKRAKESFADRDDVIAFNKKNYTKTDKHYTARDYMERERDHYLDAGVTDLKDMKKCMKYADSLVGNLDGMDDEQIKETRRKADRQAAATLHFRNTLQEQGQTSAIYDKDKQDSYIKTMVEQAERNGEDGANVRRQYENAFKAIAAYDAVNKK